MSQTNGDMRVNSSNHWGQDKRDLLLVESEGEPEVQEAYAEEAAPAPAEESHDTVVVNGIDPPCLWSDPYEQYDYQGRPYAEAPVPRTTHRQANCQVDGLGHSTSSCVAGPASTCITSNGDVVSAHTSVSQVLRRDPAA